jgi:hypothetical protein
MQRIGKVAICITLLAAFAWPATANASHGRTYGGEPTNHILLPWFEVGPLDGDLDPIGAIKDTNIVITNLWSLGGLVFHYELHIDIWDIFSNHVCNTIVPITALDQYVTNVSGLLRAFCRTGADLLAGPDGVWRGYATFELFVRDDILGFPPGPLDADIGAPPGLLGYVYQVKLQDGRAGGFNAPGYKNHQIRPIPVSPVNIDGFGPEFHLPFVDSLFFRFQWLFDGVDVDATTKIVIWSASHYYPLGPGPADLTALPDSCVCLDWPNFDICDEEEICNSGNEPLCAEVNIFPVENIVGVAPELWHGDGGWFSLQNFNPFLCPGFDGNFEPVRSDDVFVLGYAQNQATTPDESLNWEVIFPAHRGITPLFDLF